MINEGSYDVEKVKEIFFEVKGDERGSLIAFEENHNVPFDIKRVFYIFGTEQNVIRGNHANRKSKFVLITLKGSCKVKVYDTENESIYVLDNPQTGLYLDNMVWKEMYDFSDDCFLMVLASEYYDNTEYIRDYNEFLSEVLQYERV